eukprot:scaffold107722_cov36-Phaeocystis_antarctica.AAC.2
MGYPSPSCMIGHDQKTEHGQQQDSETSGGKAADTPSFWPTRRKRSPARPPDGGRNTHFDI